MTNTSEKTKSDGTITIDYGYGSTEAFRAHLDELKDVVNRLAIQKNPTPGSMIEINKEGNLEEAVREITSRLQNFYNQALRTFGSDMSAMERAIGVLTLGQELQALGPGSKVVYEVSGNFGETVLNVSKRSAEAVTLTDSTYYVSNQDGGDLSELTVSLPAFKEGKPRDGWSYVKSTHKEYLTNPSAAKERLFDPIIDSLYAVAVTSTSVRATALPRLVDDVVNFAATAFTLGCYAVHLRYQVDRMSMNFIALNVWYFVQPSEEDGTLTVIRDIRYYF